MNRRMIAIGAGTLVIGILSLGGYAIAQTSTGDAEKSLRNIQAKGPDEAIVARVNGVPIRRRSVDIAFAVSNAANIADSKGRPLANSDKADLLNREIDDELLAQAAEKNGIVASDDEVTMAIKAGIVDPLASPDVPENLKSLLRESLAASGVSLQNVTEDTDVRTGIRRFLLIQRYSSTSKSPRETRLAEAKASANIEIFLDVLNAPR